MRKQRQINRWLGLFVTLASVGAISTGCSQPVKESEAETQIMMESSIEESTVEESTSEVAEVELKPDGIASEAIIQQGETDIDEKNRTYLKEYFFVEVDDEGLDAKSFTESLKKVAGDDVSEVEGEFNLLSAIKAAVMAADYDELALSYPAEKVAKRLELYGITQEIDDTYSAHLATALDSGLISAGIGKKAAIGEAVTGQQAVNLLMAVAVANGDARNFLGYSNDLQVASKLDNMWNSFLIYDDAKLTELGKTAVEQGITTGYNLKDSAYDARFLTDLTLQYGHDNIKHAHQLLALLNSEDIIAKVQLEPKVSVYQYLLEWGPVPEATPTYEVKQFGDDLYLVFAVEYDMMLEFDTEEDMLAFNDVIETYAKKYEGNEEAVGLIASSWWQPLYSTTKTGMPEDQYHMIYDCVVRNENYSIHPFSLPENKDQVVGQLKEIAPDIEVELTERFCNTAFYNYLKGDDYQ